VPGSRFGVTRVVARTRCPTMPSKGSKFQRLHPIPPGLRRQLPSANPVVRLTVVNANVPSDSLQPIYPHAKGLFSDCGFGYHWHKLYDHVG